MSNLEIGKQIRTLHGLKRDREAFVEMKKTTVRQLGRIKQGNLAT